MTNASRQSGFTLIEVLIAMTVIALAMSAIIRTTTTSAFNTAHIRDKTFAHWIAENRLEQLRIDGGFPSTGDDEVDIEMSGRKWKVLTNIKETPDKDMRRVEIRVRGADDPKTTSISLLTGFVSRPPS